MSNICQHYQNYIIELKAARAEADAIAEAAKLKYQEEKQND